MNESQLLLEKFVEKNFVVVKKGTSSEEMDRNKVYFLMRERQVQAVVLVGNETQEQSDSCAILSINSTLKQVLQTLESYTFVLFDNEHNEYVGFTTMASITSKLAKEYERLQAFLQTILQTIDESCTVIDDSSNVLYWTKGAEQIFSVLEKDIVGKPITDFFSEKNLEILNALHNGTSVNHRQHYARNDLVVMINSNPVYLHGNVIGAVVSETDVTSLVRLHNDLYLTSEKLFNLEEEVRKTLPSADPFTYIRGNSPALKQTLKIVKKAAKTDASILIYGESGVGKELFAKAVHTLSEKENAPFVAINCGAIPSGLFESEIFGYEKGAFSGANAKGKKGKVELAEGGTLFLDEIGEMPLDMQVKILRLLQEKRFYPVGGTKEIEVNFRVVAATNRDLKEMVKEGKFREDLYYRLNVVNFQVPPLRERVDDIIELSHYFLYEISIKYNRPIHGISQNIMQPLLQYSWPGNIRELKNVIERLVVFSDNGEIKAEDLPPEMLQYMPSMQKPDATLEIGKNDGLTLSDQIQSYEKEVLLRALKKADGNKQICAKNLGVTRATLYNRMKKLGINL